MYLIPRNITKRFEFAPGFGFKELFIVLTALGIGLIVFFILGLFGVSAGIRFLVIVFFFAVGIGAISPVMTDGSTALDMLKYMIRFIRGQKLYLYVKRGL